MSLTGWAIALGNAAYRASRCQPTANSLLIAVDAPGLSKPGTLTPHAVGKETENSIELQ